MARPRLPQEVAKVTGAIEKNAGRFAGRSSPVVRSLGPAPKSLSADMVKIWNEFNADCPWLGRSDRRLVEIAVRLQHRINTDDECPVAVFAQLRMTLSSMAATPVDRSKVSEPEGPGRDPADEFLN